MVPPFRPQQPQQRRPLPPGHPGLREQGPGPQREQQPPQQGQPQSQHQPNELHRQQPGEELEQNQGNPNQPNRLRKPKPQRMSTFKLLKRLLQGERRQDFGENQQRPGQKAGPNGPDQTGQASQIPASNQNLNGVRRPPAKADKNLMMPRPGQPQPTMTFQGPLPPIIVNRNGQKKPNRKSGRPGPTRNGNVLDPISAQIIGGKPIQGVHQAATGDASLKAEDRMYVESFLFGPGESPRSLGAGSADLFGDELAVHETDNEADEDDESSTDLPATQEDYSEYHDYSEYEEEHENDVNEDESEDGTPEEDADSVDGHQNHQEEADNHENHQTDNHENHQVEDVGNASALVGHQDDSEQLDETQEQDGAQSSEHDEENHHNETESEHVESDDHKSSSEDKNELGLLMSDVENVELQAHSENSSALAILKDIISNMNKEAMKNSQTVQPVEVDEETDTLNRTKRQVNDVSQHLDEDPDKIPSKDLPLEHRGLDDEEEFDDSVDHSHHHHPHHGRKSNGSATSQLSVVLTLFTALICFSRFRW